MIIITNDKQEIISYADVGGIEDGIEVASVPEGFVENYKPLYYLYQDGEVIVNPSYKEPVQPKQEKSEIELLREEVEKLKAMMASK